MLTKRIQSIEFGVLNPSQIRKMSALDVKNPDTYDKDGYPMEGGLMDPHLGVINPGLRCKTCGNKMRECPGHFGHLELVRPVVHSEFSKRVEIILHATCMSCGRIAIPEEKLNTLVPYLGRKDIDLTKRILARTKKITKCPHCNAERAAVFLDKPTNFYYNKERLYPTQIREWLEKISDNDLKLLGYDAEKIRPEWFVITVLQVPPITIRPSITLDTGIKSEDDLTHKLVDIIRINSRLKDNIDAGAPQLIIEDLWDLLQYHVTTYFDNNTASVPPAKHRSGRALRTLVQRLKGKKGRFRYNLTGKRVNFAARSIITPDSHISINELGVPQEIANELTVPEFVTQWNVKELKKMIKQGGKVIYVGRPDGLRKKITDINKEDVTEELDVGYKIERRLQDGDIVLFNRQPSLHRLSMLAHKVKVLPGKTLRMNPVVCKPYNADFDGDEMNMHVPQTEEGKTEAKELMFVENQVISPRYGAPVIILDEDGVSGAYVLSLASTKFNRSQAMELFHILGLDEIPKPDSGKEHSGKQIFSILLPNDFNLRFKSKTCDTIQKVRPCKECTKEKCPYDAYVKIKDGVLEAGLIDANALGEGNGILVAALAKNYSPGIISEFYTKLGRIGAQLISRKGLTVSLDEYETPAKVAKTRDKAIEEIMAEGQELMRKYRNGSLPLIPGRTLGESFELSVMMAAAKAKSKVEKSLMEERMDEIFLDKPKLETMVMILSGSRGSALNLTNITGMWGQASVREGRPRRGFRQRLICANKKGDIGISAGGFIRENFMDGMKVREYFYHAMGGRQGEVDTGVSTKVSGYLYRRLANSLKDLVVNYDDTVRTSNKRIIQFMYGEDGVFPQNTVKGKNVDVVAEMYAMKNRERGAK